MNKNVFGLIAAYFFLINLSISAQQWELTDQTASNGRLDDVYFHSVDLGWTANSSGQIFKTEDGGTTWTEVYNDPVRYFRSVEFLDENIGFAGTLDSVLLKTTDGGATWTAIQHLIPTPMPGICGLSHVGDNVYGVGLFAHPAYFIKSTDQGQTWTYTDLSALADGLVECHFIDENLGFIGGIKENDGGVLLKTTDGGATWTEVYNTQSGSEYIWKLDFVNNQVAYGAIESFTGSPASIIKTVDGGNTWITLQVDTVFRDLQGIGFINQDTGWVGPRNTLVYETVDGGNTWAQISLSSNINRFFRVNSSLVYASGQYVYKYGDGAVSTQELSDVADVHSISSIAPNPFSDHLQFTVTIDRRTTARLDLYNSLGQHIQNFHSGRIDQGDYQYALDAQQASNLAAGTYYIVLRTSEGFITNPVVKGE